MSVLLFALLLSVIVFPTASTSRAITRCLVQPMAQWLNGLSLMNAALIGAVIVAGVLVAILAGEEALRLFSMMAPEALVWLTLVDASILIDLFVVGTVLAGVARLQALRDHAMMRMRTMGSAVTALLRAGRQRASRTRPTAAPKPRRSDDPDPFGLAYA